MLHDPDYLGGIFDIFKPKKMKVKVETPKEFKAAAASLPAAVASIPAATQKIEALAKAMPQASKGAEAMGAGMTALSKVILPAVGILAGGLVVYGVIRAVSAPRALPARPPMPPERRNKWWSIGGPLGSGKPVYIKSHRKKLPKHIEQMWDDIEWGLKQKARERFLASQALAELESTTLRRRA